MKRVFILGAGFSRQEGLPTAAEALQQALERPSLRDLGDLQNWARSLQTRLRTALPSSSRATIEQFFEAGRCDIEWWNSQQQLCPVGHYDGLTDADRADSRNAWLSYIEEEFLENIEECQSRSRLGQVTRFATQMRGDDTVITFNYDSLVELALTRLNRPWNHGMQDSANGGTTVLKMHGSLDWVICERDGTFPTMNLVKLFSKRNVNFEHSQTVRHKDDPEFRWELWRVPGASALAKINRCDSWLGVAGLDRIKKLHDLPGSGMTWDKAGDAVRDAEEVYIVGFSFSQYDLMARLLVVDALAARGKALDRAVVVDPCACRLADDLKPLFGIKPFAVESKAEEVNWPDLLHAQ